MTINFIKTGTIISAKVNDVQQILWIIATVKPAVLATQHKAIAMPLLETGIALDLTENPRIIQLTADNCRDILELDYMDPPSTFIPEKLPEYLI